MLKSKKVFNLLVIGFVVCLLINIVLPTKVVSSDEISIPNSTIPQTTESVTKEEAAKYEDGVLYIKDSNSSTISTRAVVADGGWNWKQIDSRKTDTKFDNAFVANLGNTIFGIATIYFGGIVLKGVMKAGEFAGVVGAYFLSKLDLKFKPKTTVYLTITTYKDTDSKNLYVKENVKAYSDSARKKLIGSYDSVHKFTKK